MFLEESVWIRDILGRAGLRQGDTVIDLGSSNEQYRCLLQPYIDYYIFKPLREAGIKIIYIDRRKEKGVDVTIDLTSSDSEALVQKIQPANAVICTNLLEHVRNKEAIITLSKKLTKPGGTIIITVPYIYKYHQDPIDTMYRPSNIDLEKIFSTNECRKIASDIIEIEENPQVIWPKQNLLIRAIRHICRRCGFKINPIEPEIIKNKVSAVAMQKL